ncbi:lipoate--protein ligase family protein [Halorubrum lipolyticum]|uniref:Biotin/lipoate A/B protein ligase n=1 Tax=Halorubrum lipolyticum DSM 21995 TaxID=1227482 RepID=M0NWU4_9EURY|nr:biotin/lipoate A/B protein ligase family protein [Halorubrum lipolyticum]EMA61744.1 biotin/lipoate A/B protein ligase [Halorubrum lipolyticum DSM 21995]
MTAPSGDWRLIREESRPGPMQMALDEVAAETAAAGGPATVRTYRWDPSCLTLGYRQDPETVDWAFCEREGIDVTRRQTGGGGIYHDARGDIAYSIAVPAADVPGELLDCYHLLCEPVLDAFDRLGIDAGYVEESVPEIYHPACYLRELHPAHDVVAGSSDDSDERRRKIAGNAQYRKRDAVIQHGSLTFSVEAERHLGTFADPPVTPAEFRDRVVGMDELADVDRGDAVAAVEAALVAWVAGEDDGREGVDNDSEGVALDRDGSWTDAELRRAEELVETKYRDEEWVRTRPGNKRAGAGSG